MLHLRLWRRRVLAHHSVRLDAQSETALALQNLAGAARQMVERDNAFQREQDVLLNHVARRVDALYRMVEQHHRAVNGHLNNLSRKKPREVKLKRTKSKRKTRNPRPVSS